MQKWILTTALLLVVAFASYEVTHAADVAASVDSQACIWKDAFQASKGSKEPIIVDLTMGLVEGAVDFDSETGLPASIKKVISRRADGDTANMSEMRMGVHTGTHLDAPSHFVQAAMDSGTGVESLSLATLNGPALLVEVPEGDNITASVMAALNIPRGVTRVLFKTSNSRKRLMHQCAFDSSWTAFTADGAQWLVANTDIRLIGVDYVSIATYADATGPHDAILGAGIIPVEGLDLTQLGPGLHQLHCLPLKLVGSDGAPCRCITIS